MIPIIQAFETIIIANGEFPNHKIPQHHLRNAKTIICCDGAANTLFEHKIIPNYVIGDLDSIKPALKEQYKEKLLHVYDQETNDLTKAVNFCVENKWNKISILGGCGKREDHSLANISLLGEYSEKCEIQMLTEYGVFVPIKRSSKFESFKGQQVSIFSLNPNIEITTKLLKYPIQNRKLNSWWEGTLNEALKEVFEIEINEGKLLVFRKYP
ncbi:thiamine pyrophosphokinase [Bacteroidales bacterium]|nr:thiamine pyrophosphokinase [Bacteroidales bacterium]